MKVLLAQASRVIRNVLRGTLRSTRYAEAPTVDVENGVELVRLLDDSRDPDVLVLLDWNLPGADVLTLLGYLGRRGALDRVSILLCVNTAQVPLAEHAVCRGACGFIERPYSDEALRAKIEECAPLRATPAVPAASQVLCEIVATGRVQADLPSLMSLPSGVIAALFAQTTKAHYEAGELLLKPGQPVEALSFVTRGEIETHAPEGRQLRGAGDCFGERAFVRGEPAKESVRALTAVDIIAVAKETLVELARRHPSLQSFLTVLLTRRPGTAAAEGSTEMAGTISSLPFPDLLQFLSSKKRTGVLILEEGPSVGRIYLERGEVTDAREDGDSGEDVFFRLACWSDARFEFRAGASSGTRTIVRSTMKLLMNCFLEARVG